MNTKESIQKLVEEFPSLSGEQPYFFHWIIERERARHGHDNKFDKPWTNDKILQTYRFCNVNRENDTVSKWVTENWRNPHDGDFNMVFAMCIARLFNRVSTLELIEYPRIGAQWFNEWKEIIRKRLKEHRELGNKIWTGAYLISTNGQKMDKIDYILDIVLTPIHKFSSPFYQETLKEFHKFLMGFDGMGSFMAAQVIADLKYTSVLRNALDWHTWAAIGPGSKRGLNRYFDRELTKNFTEEQFLESINMVQLQVREILGMEIHAQDIQNCFCEFDKYCRVKNGEGKPRSLYRGI